MSQIPIFSYKQYLDDLIRLKDHGTVDVDAQVQRPVSAGSRGLKRIKDFVKDPVHMMGEADNLAQQAAIAIAKKKDSKKKNVAEDSKKICPPATQDITLNLKNRQKAIDEYGYGPLNPDLPNDKFWQKKVEEWNLDSVEEAQQSLCGNCAAFDQRQNTLNCIAQGIDSDDPADAEGTINAGDLGYCKFLKFKCASRRTCDAWVTGGPLTDTNEITALEAAKKGLYYYVNKRKKAGISRNKNNPKAPSAQDWKNAAKTAKKENIAENEQRPAPANPNPKLEAKLIEKKKITKNEAIKAVLEGISYSKTSSELILPEAIQGNLKIWFESRWNNIVKSAKK